MAEACVQHSVWQVCLQHPAWKGKGRHAARSGAERFESKMQNVRPAACFRLTDLCDGITRIEEVEIDFQFLKQSHCGKCAEDFFLLSFRCTECEFSDFSEKSIFQPELLRFFIFCGRKSGLNENEFHFLIF